MKMTRRDFVRGGVSAFTLSFAAPAFLSDIARAQGASRRNLVVLYLAGGNDALSTLIPYNDPFYQSRRPSLFVPAANVIQLGKDSNGTLLGLHPKLTGLKSIYDAGSLAFILRTGYSNSSRSHFKGTDIWSTANPANTVGAGWLGRYLDALPSPIDPLTGWCTQREVPHTLVGREVSVPAIPLPISTYAFQSPNTTDVEKGYSRSAMTQIASHVPVDKPHLSFVNGTAKAALETLDRVGTVVSYNPPGYGTDGLSQALKTVAGAMVRGIGTKIFWVQISGFDTHSNQNVNAATAGYAGLMITLNNALLSFYTDLKNQSLLNDTLVIQFSEFGRRINENTAGGAAGTDHGAAGLMLAMGGNVQGGLYGTAPNLQPFPGNPTLENSGNDVTYETDFRSVYARILDNWLGADSVSILGGNFQKNSLTFI